ncbi:Lsr2 family DNA-binding protein [Streptomyces sp. YKOK-I1]
MTTDWHRALETTPRPHRPNPLEQLAAAARVTARRAADKDDLAELLDAIGAPTDADTLTTLLPHLSDTATGDLMTTQAPRANAYAAAAADMLHRGDSPDQVRTTLGLSDAEIAEAVQQAEAELAQKPATTPDADGTPTGGTEDGSTEDGARDGSTEDGAGDGACFPEPVAPETAQTTPQAGIEALLAWGEQHTAKGVQALAAKARSALAELATRRANEQAVTDAEGRVDRLERELARAREELRQAKTGKPVPAPATAPAPDGKLSKAQLAAIRTWARCNGHQVADRGNPAKAVLDAYFAANPHARGQLAATAPGADA